MSIRLRKRSDIVNVYATVCSSLFDGYQLAMRQRRCFDFLLSRMNCQSSIPVDVRQSWLDLYVCVRCDMQLSRLDRLQDHSGLLWRTTFDETMYGGASVLVCEQIDIHLSNLMKMLSHKCFHAADAIGYCK